ncbi:MAG: FapA family protein [Desulfobacteraceae bacterium]|nr:FapA family protein [Desulfobacteraceae bacterium]
MSQNGILKGGVQVYDDLFYLRVSRDRLQATLHAAGEAVDPASLDIDRLKQEARNMGVVHGLLLAPEPLEDGSFLIARGTPAVQGENAHIKLHVRPSIAQTNRHGLPGQDRIDYRELGNIVNVSSEQLLLEKIPLTEGTPGKDVMGGAILPRQGKDLKIKPGPGVRMTDDEMQVYATLNGKFVMVDGKPSVFGQHFVQGDVDMSVGNVTFNGESLVIQGEVLPGFKVRCRGDVTIQRGINNAEVLAGGRLEVQGSVVGDQTKVRARGDMVLGFVENGPMIEAIGGVAVKDFIVQAKLRAGGDLTVVEGNGTLVGGHYVVGGSVFARNLGSDGEVLTELNVGISPGLELRKEQLDADLKVWPEKFNELLKNISALQQMKKKEGKLPPDKEELLKKLSAVLPKIAEKVNSLQETEKEIEAEKEKLISEAVYVYGKVYPGVLVKIGSAARSIAAEEEGVVIHFDTESRQIHLRKMTREERGQKGRPKKEKEAVTSDR